MRLKLAALLLALASPALAAPIVERTLQELPPEIGTDAVLVVVSDKPGAVRWGANGWRVPPQPWPTDTRQVDAGAVETRLTGPAIDGRYRAHLGPFRQGVGSLELVLRHDDGSWGSLQGRDARVAVRAGAPSRRRPITIGRGPWLGKSGTLDLYEELQDWEYADCRGLDPADDARSFGDGKDASRDLIAFYSRREGDALYLRADLLDLGLGDERAALDLVVLVDCAPGGQTALPDFVHGRTAFGWDLAITVDHATAARVRDAQWRDVGGFLGAYFRSDLDAVEFGVSLEALRKAGWDGRRRLGFAVYTLKKGDPRIADAFREASLDDGRLDTLTWEDHLGGTAKYSVILHGNQAVQPMSWIHDLVESRSTLTPGGNPTGYLRALDAHELLRMPVNINVSATLAASAEWGARTFNDRIRRFLDGKPETGQGALLGGVIAEHIMPYFENALAPHGGGGANAAAVRLKDEALDRIYGGPPRSVFWIPERVVRGSTFQDVLTDARGRPTGYRYTVVDQTTHLTRWFGHADAHGKNGFKINRINGVSCFIINDDADQWKFANTDGGLWVWTRRDLVRKALDPDQEQLTLVFDDWEAFSGRSFTSFGVGNDNPDNYERSLRWLANHPWVQVVTLEEITTWGWREVDRGHRPDLAIETYDWLRHATEESYHNWYYGSPLEESFVNLRPERVPGVQVPKAYGELHRPGTLLGDIWANVARAPANRVRDLAEAVFLVTMYETAWHDEDMNDYLPKTASGDYRFPDTTWDPIAGWARAMHSRVGDASIAAHAARWAASPPSGVRVWKVDADEDGEDEYVVADGRAFYVFEDDGARLMLAAVRAPDGRADTFVAGLLPCPGDEARRDRETEREDGPVRPHGLVDWWATGRGSRYVNETYRAEALADGWRFTSPDGLVRKTVRLSQGRLTVEYDVAPAAGTLSVRTGLAPATLDLFMGQALTTTTRADGAVVAESGRVKVALAPRAGAQINHVAAFGGKGARGTAFAHQVEVQGQGRFGFVLEPELR
ncbi:MAG: hypothetical protein M9894_38770 [Planctomycetes bacterium]|nr:hypothetical protein [Planctomycetota bacterium]